MSGTRQTGPARVLSFLPRIENWKGNILNLHIETSDPDDDGTAPDTEHSYTLANGFVVHNILTQSQQ